MKEIAVIILNWNGRALMEEFLPSVVANSPEADIIIADNGSTDGSMKMISEKFPSLETIILDKNYGFAEGYNRSIAQIENPYVVLLNSDVEVTKDWLKEPLRLMKSDSQIAGVQPKILAARNKEYFEYAGAAGGFMDKYGYPFCRGRIFSQVEKDEGQYDNQCDIFWASGACLFMNTKIYKNEGGLDKDFFAHQEEIDMCWRLKSRGYRLVYTPLSIVYHVGGGTLAADSPGKTFLNFRNNLLMLYKNLPQKDLKKVMRIRWFLDNVASLKFFLTGEKGNAKAVHRAWKEFIDMLPEFRLSRQQNMERTKVDDIPEIKKDSLLAAFYMKGMKKFSDLKMPDAGFPKQ